MLGARGILDNLTLSKKDEVVIFVSSVSFVSHRNTHLSVRLSRQRLRRLVLQSRRPQKNHPGVSMGIRRSDKSKD